MESVVFPSPRSALKEATNQQQQSSQEQDQVAQDAATMAIDNDNQESDGADKACKNYSDKENAVEARLKPSSNLRTDKIRHLLGHFIESNYDTLLQESEITEWKDVHLLKQHLDIVRIAECGLENELITLSDVELHIHVYQPALSSSIQEFAASGGQDEDPTDNENQVQAASITELPNVLLDGLWSNLFYEDGIKENLLNFIYSTLLFSEADIDPNIISFNRVVLLHGPPGTGKTSLCKALAQKLSIRLSNRYPYGKIVEINAHSLFSKWFSESGKLVQRLFSNVMDLVDDENCFVVVLIDEVESLTSARAGAISGKEPSDALRVVNALLTQLDKLKTRKNVLVVTTSNLSHSIDPAFVDRADIKQYIGLPPPEAVFWILSSCLRELSDKEIISKCRLLDWKALKLFQQAGMMSPSQFKLQSQKAGVSQRQQHRVAEEDESKRISSLLYDLALTCRDLELSGRFLRRLPILAHARYIGLANRNSRSVVEWIDAMQRVVADENRQLGLIQRGHDYSKTTCR